MTTENRTAMTRPISYRRETHAGFVPLIVAYDISEDRRRNRLHRLLRGFGEPVQKSLFLCWVVHARRRRLENLLEDFMRVPHKGKERVDCMVSYDMSLTNNEAWVCE